jgi:DNA-binding response OmpR family regulator
LRRAIREEGLSLEIAVVQDGDKAIDFLENCREDEVPQLVIIDINLMKRDGIEVLRKCRFAVFVRAWRRQKLSSSRHHEPSDHSRSELLGVDAYMRKPVRLEGFSAVVDRIRTLLEHTAEK